MNNIVKATAPDSSVTKTVPPEYSPEFMDALAHAWGLRSPVAESIVLPVHFLSGFEVYGNKNRRLRSNKKDPCLDAAFPDDIFPEFNALVENLRATRRFRVHVTE